VHICTLLHVAFCLHTLQQPLLTFCASAVPSHMHLLSGSNPLHPRYQHKLRHTA
jgi:hypothetical protein